MINSYNFHSRINNTTQSELPWNKNIPDLIEKVIWLRDSKILHKAQPCLITTSDTQIDHKKWFPRGNKVLALNLFLELFSDSATGLMYIFDIYSLF